MTREGLPEYQRELTLCGAPAFPSCGWDGADRPMEVSSTGSGAEEVLEKFCLLPFFN